MMRKVCLVSMFFLLRMVHLYAQENEAPYSRYTKTIYDSIFVVGDLILAPQVRFGFDLPEGTIEKRDSGIVLIREFFERNPSLVAEIRVHTDARGSEPQNKLLSESQAKEILLRLHRDATIRGGRLTPVGMGESDPLFTEEYIHPFMDDRTKYEGYHQANRRIEIRITGFLGGSFSRSERYTKTIYDSVFVVGDRLLAPDIHFCDGRLCEHGMDSVQALTDFFRRNPFLTAEIICYSDCRGQDAFNQDFSLRKANYVVDLIEKDSSIISERLRPAGAGENDPVYDCDFIAGLEESTEIKEGYYQANRRFEILITGFLHPDFYDNAAGNRSNDPIIPREAAYYDDLVEQADRAVLEQDYVKALYYYKEAIAVGPAGDPYPAEQVQKIEWLLSSP
jgi:outer membrane protein OmpA-like peptidoglycan-associated protein